MIEFLTGVLFLLIFVLRGPSLYFLADAAFGSILLAVFMIDLRHMIIPDRLNLTGGVLGFLFAMSHGIAGILRAGAGAITGMAVLMGMALLGKLLFRRESMGRGDFKLVIVTGLFLGPIGNLAALTAAILLGGGWGVLYLVFRKGKPGGEIPFGPFIAMGCFLIIFFHEQVFRLVSMYLSLY